MKKNAKPVSVKKVEKSTTPTRLKVYGFVMLFGLFACGYMLGMGTEKFSTSKQMKQTEETIGQEACEVIEKLLVKQTYPIDSSDYREHLINANTYERIATKGCPATAEKYKELAAKEMEIAAVLQEQNEAKYVNTDLTPCEEIEKLLEKRIVYGTDIYSARLDNASVYSVLSERGCSDNSEKYKQLALNELEIASALANEQMYQESDIEYVIDTYKRLDMEKAAQDFLDKIEKLKNPTIEFIMQMEKIIND